jgi:hypothetical protein
MEPSTRAEGGHLAADLVANGAPEDLALPSRYSSGAALPGTRMPNDPLVGNFLLVARYGSEDLNAVDLCWGVIR